MKDTLGKEFYESADKAITIKRQQTAVEWLAERLESITQELFLEANEMFEKQIIDAWENGNHTEMRGGKYLKTLSEEYYNETFNK